MAGKNTTQVSIIVDLSYETVKRWYFEYVSLNYEFGFVNLRFFIEIAKKMKRGELFKEEVDHMLANLISCRASQHRKEWLEHENRCLEVKNKSLTEENTRLEDNIKAKLSYSPSRFTPLSDDL